MAEPLSEDLRKRLIAAVEQGASRRAVAERFGGVASTVTKLVKHLERTGSLEPGKQGGDRRSERVEAHADEIMALVGMRRTSRWKRSHLIFSRRTARRSSSARSGAVSTGMD